MVIVLVKNLLAKDLGYDEALGLLYAEGSRLDTLLLLPNLEKKLLSEGFAVTEEEWKQQQAGVAPRAKARPAPKNKRRRAPFSNK